MWDTPFLRLTRQRWKLGVFFVGLSVAGLVLYLSQRSDRSGWALLAVPVAAFGGIGLLAWLAATIRCPRCGYRFVWRAMRDESMGEWTRRAFELRRCPECGLASPIGPNVRARAARLVELIGDVADRRIEPETAIQELGMDDYGPLMNNAVHRLIHFGNDRDIRSREPTYEAHMIAQMHLDIDAINDEYELGGGREGEADPASRACSALDQRASERADDRQSEKHRAGGRPKVG